MISNNHECNIPHTNDLLQGAQSHPCEVSSPSQMLSGEIPNFIKKKSKCHGNRKLQHFKRKYRARGLNKKQIPTLIHTKKKHSI
jgi:hypothetical protein